MKKYLCLVVMSILSVDEKGVFIEAHIPANSTLTVY